MDVVNDAQVLENIEVLETYVKDCNEKCQRVNCQRIDSCHLACDRNA